MSGGFCVGYMYGSCQLFWSWRWL